MFEKLKQKRAERQKIKRLQKECFEKALSESKKQMEWELKKETLLSANTDFALLEEFIQRINENPLLRVKITTKDGAVYEIDTAPKKPVINYLEPHEDFVEVR